ncbi:MULTISPECIES: hypothetical protein [Niallia]|jgi:hypothetical protein|nr:hypothetical protein [Niallia circulans]MED3840000.1 hypothetical protein [Niallia circulans]MED4250362.1 hypothetical protein [Niallia circulans]MED5099272.1 hypothetical protein [Niallia circulans]QKH63439.1 hypothetical protein FOC77_23790 [Niallia circulans]
MKEGWEEKGGVHSADESQKGEQGREKGVHNGDENRKGEQGREKRCS